MNQQPPEKRSIHPEGFIEVHSIFPTIQGEGPFCGTPATFIRLAGCNLQCPACDTDYTSSRRFMAVGDILSEVLSHQKMGLVVITGGEPFRQDLNALLNALVGRGYFVQIETNGTLPPPDRDDYSILPCLRFGVYIVCSPKTGRVHPKIARWACVYKYVLADNWVHADGLPTHALGHPAEPMLARPVAGIPVYLQPEDAKDPEVNQANLQAVIKSCMKHGYILQMQVHKLINME